MIKTKARTKENSPKTSEKKRLTDKKPAKNSPKTSEKTSRTLAAIIAETRENPGPIKFRGAYIAPQQLSHPSSQFRRRSQQNTRRPDAKTSSSSTAAITATATDDTSALGESEVRFF
jgi:hypothetical protein